MAAAVKSLAIDLSRVASPSRASTLATSKPKRPTPRERRARRRRSRYTGTFWHANGEVPLWSLAAAGFQLRALVVQRSLDDPSLNYVDFG